VLPFTGLIAPQGVAVDAAGNLYAADTGNNRVLKLPAG
jgi:serine/threonine-protein kinase